VQEEADQAESERLQRVQEEATQAERERQAAAADAQGATPGQPPVRAPNEPPFVDPSFGSTGEQVVDDLDLGDEKTEDENTLQDEKTDESDSLSDHEKRVRQVADYVENWETKTNPSRGQLAHTYGVLILEGKNGKPLVKFEKNPRNKQGLNPSNVDEEFVKTAFGFFDEENDFVYYDNVGMLYVKVGNKTYDVTLSRNGEDINEINTVLDDAEEFIIKRSGGKYTPQKYPDQFKVMALLYTIFLIGLKNDEGVEIISPGIMNRGRPRAGFEPSPFSSMFMWM